MFKIVSVFERQNNDAKYFYEVYLDNPTIKQLISNMKNAKGFIDLQFTANENKSEVIVSFDTKENFQYMINENIFLYSVRQQLISAYCARVGHKYSYYELNE